MKGTTLTPLDDATAADIIATVPLLKLIRAGVVSTFTPNSNSYRLARLLVRAGYIKLVRESCWAGLRIYRARPVPRRRQSIPLDSLPPARCTRALRMLRAMRDPAAPQGWTLFREYGPRGERAMRDLEAAGHIYLFRADRGLMIHPRRARR